MAASKLIPSLLAVASPLFLLTPLTGAQQPPPPSQPPSTSGAEQPPPNPPASTSGAEQPPPNPPPSTSGAQPPPNPPASTSGAGQPPPNPPASTTWAQQPPPNPPASTTVGPAGPPCPPIIAESLPFITYHSIFGDCATEGKELSAEGRGIGFHGHFAGYCEGIADVTLELRKYPTEGFDPNCGQDSDCVYQCTDTMCIPEFGGCQGKCVEGECRPDFEKGMQARQNGEDTHGFCVRFENIPTFPEAFEQACFQASNPGNNEEEEEVPQGPQCPQEIQDRLYMYGWHDFKYHCDDTDNGTGDVVFEAELSSTQFYGEFHGACDPTSPGVDMDLYWASKDDFFFGCMSDDECRDNHWCHTAVCMDGMCQPDWEAGMEAHLGPNQAATEDYCFGYSRFQLRPEELDGACFSTGGGGEGDSPCDHDYRPAWNDMGCAVFEGQEEYGFPDHPSEWERDIASDCLDIYDEYLRCLWREHPEDHGMGWRSPAVRKHLVDISGRHPGCVHVPQHVLSYVRPVPCH